MTRHSLWQSRHLRNQIEAMTRRMDQPNRQAMTATDVLLGAVLVGVALVAFPPGSLGGGR